MKLDRLLVAVDLSPPSERALDAAVALARPDTRLTILHVRPIRQMQVLDLTYVERPEALVEALRDVEQRLRGWLDARGLAAPRATLRIETGDPLSTIAVHAAEHDLVVVGTHGRSGVEHLLLGSVAERVVRTVDRPVLVVR